MESLHQYVTVGVLLHRIRPAPALFVCRRPQEKKWHFPYRTCASPGENPSESFRTMMIDIFSISVPERSYIGPSTPPFQMEGRSLRVFTLPVSRPYAQLGEFQEYRVRWVGLEEMRMDELDEPSFRIFEWLQRSEQGQYWFQ